jgi:regulator of protease activity HflC (stomatin/prohibitin superfamily)
MTVLLEALAIVVVLLAMLAAASIRVLREYERAVVFRLGRLVGVRGPGVILLIPAVDRMVRTSLRTVTLNVPPQDVITRDNVPARVDAVVYFRIVDAAASVVRIEDAHKATSQIAQTTLRSVLGKAELDALLSERESLNEDLQQIIDEQTEPWGIKVTTVEIKDVGIPSPMQRAMARQAQAERERRAKVINAEGELQAAAKLSEAAGVLSVNPASIQLRYLQTLSELGGEQSSTIVFPLPIDVLSMLRPPAAAPAAPAAPAAEEPARLAAGEANGALAPGEEARERVSS